MEILYVMSQFLMGKGLCFNYMQEITNFKMGL